MSKHQTIHKELKHNFNKLKKHPDVKNVGLGRYDNCRHKYAPGTIRYQMDTTSGFKAKGYDGSGTIDLFIYLKDMNKKEEVIKTLGA